MQEETVNRHDMITPIIRLCYVLSCHIMSCHSVRLYTCRFVREVSQTCMSQQIKKVGEVGDPLSASARDFRIHTF